MTRLVIVGGAGRMGRALVACAAQLPDLRVTGVVASAHSATLGQDAGEMAGLAPIGVKIASDLSSVIHDADVVVDFSSARAARDHVDRCALARVPLVLGTTGLPEGIESDFTRAVARIPLLVASNTSVGIALLAELVKQAARVLPQDFDIEIIEAHHRAKRDAPSGTALSLGEAAARGRDQSLREVSVVSREPGVLRQQGEIGFAVIRAGDIVGDHEVRFAGPGEQIALLHRATDRAIFARGALQAACWLSGQRPGRYRMGDIFGFKSGL